MNEMENYFGLKLNCFHLLFYPPAKAGGNLKLETIYDLLNCHRLKPVGKK